MCFDMWFDVTLNKRLNKPSICRWSEPPWRPCELTLVNGFPAAVTNMSMRSYIAFSVWTDLMDSIPTYYLLIKCKFGVGRWWTFFNFTALPTVNFIVFSNIDFLKENRRIFRISWHFQTFSNNGLKPSWSKLLSKQWRANFRQHGCMHVRMFLYHK